MAISLAEPIESLETPELTVPDISADPYEGSLPIFRWVGVEPAGPPAAITSESFQVQRNKNEYSDLNTREKSVKKMSAWLSRITVKPRTITDIYAKLPAAEALETSTQPLAIAEASEITDETQIDDEPQALIEIYKEEKSRFTVGSLFKAVPKVRQGVRTARQNVFKAVAEHKKETVLSVGAAVGALAVGILVHKGYGPDLFSNHTHKTTTPETNSSIASAIDFKTLFQLQVQDHAQKITAHAAEISHKAKYAKESLQYHGDRIWNHASTALQAKLGHKPTVDQINNLTERVLRLNHMSWRDAKQMNVHQAFKVFGWMRRNRAL